MIFAAICLLCSQCQALRLSRPIIAFFARLLSVFLLVVACQTAGAEMVWHRGALGDPGSLDPHKTTTVIEGNILAELYEGLVTFDAKGEIVPGVARSWTANVEGDVYTFQFRPDAKWSNGDKVEPDDFVFAFRRLLNPATAAQYSNLMYFLRNAEKVNKGELPLDSLGVRSLGETALEISLERPVPYFIEALAHLTALPVHRKSVEMFGNGFTKPGKLIGNGAFVLKDFTPNDCVTLVKNSYYYDAARVALDKQIFYPIEDRSAALRRFMAGEIDSYGDIPFDQIAFVQDRLGEQFRVSPYLAAYYYAFDTRHKPFDDPRVRRALAMVIDREFLAERIWGGTMEPSYSFVPPGIRSYGLPATVSWKDQEPFDREDEAKRLLREAGYGPGRKLEIEIRYNSSENHKATAVAVADMWRVLGVETRLLNTDATSHFAYLHSKGPFDVARFAWYGDYADAQNYLFLAESENDALNIAHYANADFGALMRKAAEERDPQRRTGLLHRAETMLLEDQPYLVLMSYRSSNLVSRKLHGWEPNVLDHHPGRYITIGP